MPDEKEFNDWFANEDHGDRDQLLQCWNAALRQRVEREQWQPIQGAMKDGSWYIIGRIVNGELVWWYKSRFAQGYWRTDSGVAEPTHYLPLPDCAATILKQDHLK